MDNNLEGFPTGGGHPDSRLGGLVTASAALPVYAAGRAGALRSLAEYVS